MTEIESQMSKKAMLKAIGFVVAIPIAFCVLVFAQLQNAAEAEELEEAIFGSLYELEFSRPSTESGCDQLHLLGNINSSLDQIHLSTVRPQHQPLGFEASFSGYLRCNSRSHPILGRLYQSWVYLWFPDEWPAPETFDENIQSEELGLSKVGVDPFGAKEFFTEINFTREIQKISPLDKMIDKIFILKPANAASETHRALSQGIWNYSLTKIEDANFAKQSIRTKFYESIGETPEDSQIIRIIQVQASNSQELMLGFVQGAPLHRAKGIKHLHEQDLASSELNKQVDQINKLFNKSGIYQVGNHLQAGDLDETQWLALQQMLDITSDEKNIAAAQNKLYESFRKTFGDWSFAFDLACSFPMVKTYPTYSNQPERLYKSVDVIPDFRSPLRFVEWNDLPISDYRVTSIREVQNEVRIMDESLEAIQTESLEEAFQKLDSHFKSSERRLEE